MKTIKHIILSFIILITTISCAEYSYAQTDIQYNSYNISYTTVIRYGTPIYIDGTLNYFIYNNMYYYPYYYNDYYYLHPFRYVQPRGFRFRPHHNFRPYRELRCPDNFYKKHYFRKPHNNYTRPSSTRYNHNNHNNYYNSSRDSWRHNMNKNLKFGGVRN